MDDFGSSDIFPPSRSSPAAVGDTRAALTEIRRKLQELDQQLRMLLIMLDREPVGTVPRSSGPGVRPPVAPSPMSNPSPAMPLTSARTSEEGGALRTIEGVFDGQNMVGPDGKQYSVPANYASKSKLVEGDILKLTITGRGAFVYKQIVPIPRERRMGILTSDDVTREHVVLVPDADEDRTALARAVVGRSDLPSVAHQRYRVLRASVTFHHGTSGDEVSVLVPKGTPSTWAAVENIIKR